MMNKFYLITVFMLLLVPSVFAEEPRFYGQQGANLTIIDHCYSDGDNCVAAIPCNITITNEDFILENEPMTNTGNSLQYIFQNTSERGKYQSSVVCENGNVSQFDNFYFITNKDGVPTSGSDSIIFGVLISFMALAGLASWYFKDGLRRSFVLLTGLMVPVIMFTAYNFTQNALLGNTIVSLALFGYTTSLILYLALVFYILWDLMMSLKLQDNATQGAQTTGSIQRGEGKRKLKKDYEDDNDDFSDND